MKYKVSVIIPVYNAEKYLETCLDSVINQTLDSVEIICVNDGSSDSSKTILDNYKAKYKNIIVLDQENKGAIEARVNGYIHASGEYITFLDNDDFIDKDMYKILYNNAKTEDLDMCICNYNFYPQKPKNKSKWFKPYKGKVDCSFIQHNVLLWNRIVKKELLDNLNFKQMLKEFGEGAYSIVVINSKKIKTIDNCLYNYRVGHSSLSTNLSNIKYFERIVAQEEKRMNYVYEHIEGTEWKEYFCFSYLYYCQLMMVVGAYNNRKDIFIKYKKIIKENKLFSKKYKEFFINNLSVPKYYFFKYFGSKSYFITRLFVKVYY